MVLGRPRSFNIDKAIDKALNLFWAKGYEGTSLTDLTEAMGINRPSLYAAFGNKEQLFTKALERYADKMCFMKDALAEKTALKSMEKLLMLNAAALTDPKNPRGCLAVQGALSCGEESESVRLTLVALRDAGEQRIKKRLEQGVKDGDLPKHTKPAELARYISAVSQGMSVQASSGATHKELQQVVKIALSALTI